MTLRRNSWRAIGTNVDVLVVDGDVAAARMAVQSTIDSADAAFSRFRADSELSSVQQSNERTPVGAMLGLAIAAGLRGAQLTDGLVDPTVGRAMRLSGYDRDFGSIANRRDIAPVITAESIPGWRAISWDPTRGELRIPRGVELDFGSTGKALIADLAVFDALRASGAQGVLVSVGGDMATAGEPPDTGWRVRLADNSTAPPDDAEEVVVIQGGALATSSTTVRRWLGGQLVVHHILDPRTGRPAVSPWRTASVVASNCVDANICATAAIILGVDAEAWLSEHHVSALLVAQDGSSKPVGGWPLALETVTA